MMYREQPISFKSMEQQLQGVFNHPSTPQRSIGVILLNGWGGYRIGPHRIYVKLGRLLSSCGFPVMRFDFRGTGDSDGTLSEHTEDNVAAFLENTKSAQSYFVQYYNLDKCYLLGLCTGGEIATLYASGVKTVQGIILWSTASRFGKLRTEKATNRVNQYGRVYLRKLLVASNWKRILKWQIDVRGIFKTLFYDFDVFNRTKNKSKRSKENLSDSFQILRTLDGHLLLIYGTADPNANESCAFFEKQATMANIVCSSYLIQGADASFSANQFENEVMEITKMWLIEQDNLE